MTRLWIVSDLHLESSPWLPATVPEHDALLIAGDIANGWSDSMFNHREIQRRTGKPVIMVPGNHDIFGVSLGGFDCILDGVRFVLPRGQSIVIGSVRFIGATLWTDWQLRDQEWQAQAWAARHLPEYSHVFRDDGDLIWPIDVAAEHQRHLAAIDDVLAVPFDGPTVVITHHAPSLMSVPKGERTLPESAAYASDLEPMMLKRRPALWVHGHIHTAADYRIGETRVVCNPRGYQREGWSEETGWTENLVVEV